MPSTLDSVRPIGVETPVEGGTQTRTNACEIDPTQDAVAVAGVHLVGPGVTPTDKTTYVDRASGGLRLTDATTQRLLSELVTSVAGGVNAHSSLRDLQHFLAGEGPGPDGFASGAYLTINYSGILPTSWTWWASNAQTLKIVQRTLTYQSSLPLVASETWQVFNAAGAVVRTLVDTHQYSSVMRTSTTRTWS